MRLGFEVELSHPLRRYDDIITALSLYIDNISELRLGFTEFKSSHPQFTQFNGINMFITDEHYPNHIEFNFFPVHSTKKSVRLFSQFIDVLCNETGLTTAGFSPRFVGTHVHIFVRNIAARKRKLYQLSLLLMRGVLSELMKDFVKIPDMSSEQAIEFISDCYRSIMNHTVLKYFDAHHNMNEFQQILSEYDLSFHYGSEFGNDKPRYQPVIYSPNNRKGKPETIEFRYMSNYLLRYHPERIVDIIRSVGAIEAATIDLNWTTLAIEVRSLFNDMARMVAISQDTLHNVISK